MPLEGLVNFDIDWKIITLAMSERAYPVVCTISDSEIAIMGGVKEGGLLKGVFNFNVNTYRVKKVGDHTNGGFMTQLNSPSLMGGDHVFWLSGERKRKILSWKVGE